VTAPVLGPLALPGMASKKNKSTAFATFADGTVHHKALDGTSAIRSGKREVVDLDRQESTAIASHL
jgi:hypothetical protein